MTQAPTPGPLSGDDWIANTGIKPDNLPASFDVLFEDGALIENITAAIWSRNGHGDIASWRPSRLAPTAPVEASGSEREGYVVAFYEIADMLGIGAQAASPAEVWSQKMRPRLLAALRPQPSGETRSILTRDQIINALNDHIDAELAGPTETRAEATGIEEAADAILALLSARPLALGGQQGESGDTAFKIASDLHAAYEQLIYGLPKYLEAENLTDEENMIREAYITLDVTAHRLAALSTTPARAESQDEGARHLEMLRDMETASRGPFRMKAQNAALKWAIERLHPSPTPAADADRVREAIADVISHYSDWRTALMAADAAEETPEDGSGKPGYWLHQIKVLDRIQAALKSTAAKEGEKS